MTALDSRPQAPTAPAVSPEVAARRADRRLTGAYAGRELNTRELETIRDLELTAAYGARTTGDLDSYVASLLGIGRVSAYEERQISWAEDTARGAHDPVWSERYEAQARVRRAAGQ